LLERIKKPFHQALEDAGLKGSQLDEVLLVGGSTRIPMVQDLVKSLTGKEPNRSVNPDEVVAIGAAVQAGVLGGDVKDILLLDVTPLSLGVETQGGLYDRVIERNTTIPTTKTNVYTTAVDNQPEVEIHILQGERPLARENKSLGRFHLAGIPPAPARVPQIEVTFDIDANGILHVSAKDRGTGNQQKITITGSGNLNRDEIDRMVREAEANADNDKKFLEEAELRNKSDQLAYNTEKLVREHNDKIDEGQKSSIEEKIADLRKALAETDVDAIRAAFAALEAESHALSQTLYDKVSADDKAAAPEEEKVGAGVGAEGDVIDADFKDEK
jgi:molecular chaperone DnaK